MPSGQYLEPKVQGGSLSELFRCFQLGFTQQRSLSQQSINVYIGSKIFKP